jgi:hypothetical protein
MGYNNLGDCPYVTELEEGAWVTEKFLVSCHSLVTVLNESL